MAARERVEFDVIGRDLGGSKAFKDVGDAADKAGDKIKDSGDKAKDSGEKYRGLASEIAEVEGNVRRLAAEIDRTGNKELFKDLRKQQTELRKLTRVKDLLPDDNESRDEAIRFGGRLAEGVAAGLSKAGGPVASAMSNVFGTLPPGAQVALGAGVVAAVTAVGPLVGATVGGAVVGAAGAGGIIGGVAIAAKHPEVQAAAKLTGEAYSQEMQRAAVSFVPATVESLSIVRSHVHEIGDDLERAFSAASPMLPGLTEKAMSGATQAVEGFADAVERSGPVVDALGTIAERAGGLVGDVFSDLSEHSVEGAHGLTMLWGVFEVGIRSLASTVEGLMITYGWFEKLGAMVTGDVATLGRLTAEQEAAKTSGGGLSTGLQDLINSFKGAGNSAATAAAEVETFNDMVKRLAGENLTAEQANLRLEEAIDRATAAGKRNNDGIDTNTEKGRTNRKLLLDIASAANASSDAILTQTGSQELASAATERGRAKFLETARAMGVSKTEAIKLADKLFAIPNIKRTVTVTANTQPAIDSAKNAVARINNMHARISVGARGTTSFGGSAHTGEGYSTGMSAGGRVGGDGPLGVDSQVRVLAPDEYVLRGAAARAIGYDQLDQLNQADRRPVALRAGTPAAAAAPSGAGTAGPSVEDFYRAMVRALQTVPLVRLDSGRQADLYSRGG